MKICTLETIDIALCRDNLIDDHHLIGDFLCNIFSQEASDYEIKVFSSFIHKLQTGQAKRMAAYVVKLLMSESYDVRSMAVSLPQFDEPDDGYDLDLEDFSFTQDDLILLCHRTLGFCLHKPRLCLGVIIAAWRLANERTRSEIAELIFNPLLINYPTLMEHFDKIAGADTDPVRKIFQELRDREENYLRNIQDLSNAKELKPSASDRYTQAEKNSELSKEMQSKVHANSVMMQFVHTSTVLYGRGSISYMQLNEESKAYRQENQFTSHEVSIEIPRLEILDPIGQALMRYHFRSRERNQ